MHIDQILKVYDARLLSLYPMMNNYDAILSHFMQQFVDGQQINTFYLLESIYSTPGKVLNKNIFTDALVQNPHICYR